MKFSPLAQFLSAPSLVSEVQTREVGHVYGVKDPVITPVNAARRFIFATLNRPVQSIPPSRGVLLKPVHRGPRQLRTSKPLSPQDWGWPFQEGRWQPVCTDKPAIWGECRDLDRCGCASQCATMICRALQPASCAKEPARTKRQLKLFTDH